VLISWSTAIILCGNISACLTIKTFEIIEIMQTTDDCSIRCRVSANFVIRQNHTERIRSRCKTTRSSARSSVLSKLDKQWIIKRFAVSFTRSHSRLAFMFNMIQYTVLYTYILWTVHDVLTPTQENFSLPHCPHVHLITFLCKVLLQQFVVSPTTLPL